MVAMISKKQFVTGIIIMVVGAILLGIGSSVISASVFYLDARKEIPAQRIDIDDLRKFSLSLKSDVEKKADYKFVTEKDAEVKKEASANDDKLKNEIKEDLKTIIDLLKKK